MSAATRVFVVSLGAVQALFITNTDARPVIVAHQQYGETVLYAFKGGTDGAYPYAGLIADSAGNFYGTTSSGGSSANCAGGCGTVFKVTPGGTETVLYSFRGGSDGEFPKAGLVADNSGDLYGTTEGGGAAAAGTVFRLTPTETETVLYSFQGGSDGEFPEAGLIADSSGNLYGTTTAGGGEGRYCKGGSCGTIFKLGMNGTEAVLHSFHHPKKEGDQPYAGLIFDSSGNLYGTTLYGGNRYCLDGCGAVFRLAPDGTESLLHKFTDRSGDGASPAAGIIADTAGNLYGTTSAGGGTGCDGLGCGVVFRIGPRGTETVLHAFTGDDGALPTAGLIMDGAGNLYGTTSEGGAEGTVFKLAPDGTETVLYAFKGGSDGEFPAAGVIMDGSGNLYGTTPVAGPNGAGIVFKISKKAP